MNNIKKLREEKGLSRAQLAWRVGVNAKTVERWEEAMQMPSFTNIYKICKILGCSRKALSISVLDQARNEIRRDELKSYENGTCLLFDQMPEDERVCMSTNCLTCGWNMAEHQRRIQLTRTEGLKTLPNGKRGLIVHRKKKGETNETE